MYLDMTCRHISMQRPSLQTDERSNYKQFTILGRQDENVHGPGAWLFGEHHLAQGINECCSAPACFQEADGK